jgi:hypothetical protein
LQLHFEVAGADPIDEIVAGRVPADDAEDAVGIEFAGFVEGVLGDFGIEIEEALLGVGRQLGKTGESIGVERLHGAGTYRPGGDSSTLAWHACVARG